jgi:DNA repair exonuclease SbcCD ATPase subunit
MSFGDAELVFKDDGFIRVSGQNQNPLDNAGSNGSGKSSLWEAIIWAITGETIRGTKHIVNMYDEDGCFVDLEMYVDKTLFRIVRSKDHKVYKTNLLIYVNDENVSGKGIRESEKILEQRLPDVTSSLLGSVIILGQGLPQKFTNNTPSGRKEVLEKLSKSDFMIEDLKARVTSRRSEIQSSLRSFEDKITQNESKSQFLVKQIHECNDRLEKLSSQDLDKELSQLLDNRNEITNEIDLCDNKLDTLTSSQTNQNDELVKITNIELQEMTELQNQYSLKVQPQRETLANLNAELSSLQKELTKLKSIKDVCPTCGQKLPDVHKPDTTDVENQIHECSNNIASLRDYISEEERIYESTKQQLTSKFAAQKAVLKNSLNDISTELFDIKSKRAALQASWNKVSENINNLNIEIAQLQNTINECNKIIRDNNEILAILSDDIMYNNKQKDLAQSRLEVISKFDTALKRDFRGYLLSTVISFIEQRAKHYSKIIFDTTNICFCLDGNNIDISYMDRAYENLSGGEKQKIDLIIQFSIRDMLSKQLGFTSNILVLDEVFDGLDSKGCTKVIDMIASVSDIKNIFIVTHRKDLSIPSDKELIVAKSSVGISEIRK